MNLQGKTVLVTGGTGFIGGRLVERLHIEHGCRIRVLVRTFANATRIAPYPIELVGGDLRDAESVEQAVRGCDVVFHCAHDFVPTLEGQRKTGVEGTRNVARAVLTQGVERFVHLSSVAVYQPLLSGEVTESSPWPESRNPYVLAKREAEELIAELHAGRGLPAVVLQPTIVYGPFASFWTLNPVRRLRSGRVPLLDGGNGICNPVYVDDVVESMTLAATVPGAEGETCLISGSEPVTWREFYEALDRIAGTDSLVELSVEEMRRMARRRERRKRLHARLLRKARNPDVWSRVGRLWGLGVEGGGVSGRVVSALAARWLESAEEDRRKAGMGIGPAEPSIHLPTEPLIEAQTARARVRIDRARQILGYAPAFDLARGMEVTGRYLEWTNLLGRVGLQAS